MPPAANAVAATDIAVPPMADNVFTLDADGPHLIGGRRKSDGRVVFPIPCGVEAQKYEPMKLSPEGTLWSFTVQRFRPKSPPYAGADDEKSFQPFAIGYVELPGQVIVETRIAVDTFARLKIGMPMRLAVVPFVRADGQTVSSYVFRPIP
jgi:uncharacterized OB-fold protein